MSTAVTHDDPKKDGSKTATVAGATDATAPAVARAHGKPDAVANRQALHKLQVDQSKARRDLAHKQADARAKVTGDDLTKLKVDQAAEQRALFDKQQKELADKVEADPTLRGISYNGVLATEQVDKLHADLVAMVNDPTLLGIPYVVGDPSNFGLDLKVFDPVTGQVFIAAQGSSRGVGVGQPFSIQTADQVVASIVAHRVNQGVKR